MSRFRVVFFLLIVLATSTTLLAVSGLAATPFSAGAALATSASSATRAIDSTSNPSGMTLSPAEGAAGLTYMNVASQDLVTSAQRSSLFIAPASWIFVVGAWIWRGRVKARWTEVGFEADVFELFVKMKGGATRIRLLNALEVPKDRLQVAEQLELDWKAVDRHMQVLNKYGFVREKATYGTTKVYEVTLLGRTLLKLCNELEEADGVRLVEQRILPL